MIAQPCAASLMPEGSSQRINSGETLGPALFEQIPNMVYPTHQALPAPTANSTGSLVDHIALLPTTTAGVAAAGGGPLNQLEQALSFINAHKVAQHRTLAPAAGTVQSSGGSSQGSREVKWIQPSGPRQAGQGVENEEQGIISAEQAAAGTVVLRMSLLAAGFIIGPSGATVRDIMRVSGADIKSWTEQANSRTRRSCRVFVLEGDDADILAAIAIITAAIDRYKDLCEGRCCGQAVGRIQRIMGVEFSYQPPPKNVVPFAAALKGQVQRPTRSQSTTAFDIRTLMQQQQQQQEQQQQQQQTLPPQPQPQPYMLVGNANVNPYLAPYANILVPPASPPTMLPYGAPYGAMYGMAMPPLPANSSASGAASGGSAGTMEHASLGGMIGGYDFAQAAVGTTAATQANNPSMYQSAGYVYPGGNLAAVATSGVPPAPTPGWAGVLMPNGMLLPPPSPIRYHGVPAAGVGMPAMDALQMMGLQGAYMPPPMMAPDLTWQMASMTGQQVSQTLQAATGAGGGDGGIAAAAAAAAKAPVGSGQGSVASDLPAASKPASSITTGTGAGHEMPSAPHATVMHGHSTPAAWYGSNPGAGMMYAQPPVRAGAVAPPNPGQPLASLPTPQPAPTANSGPNSPARTAAFGSPHSVGTAARLNPQAATWASSPGQHHAQQIGPAKQSQDAQTSSLPRAFAANEEQLQFQPTTHIQRQQQVKASEPLPGADKGSRVSAVEPHIGMTPVSTGSALTFDSNKENVDLHGHAGAPAEPPAPLSKTPRRPTPGGSSSNTSHNTAVYTTPLDVPLPVLQQEQGLHTPLLPHAHAFIAARGDCSSCGSCSVTGGIYMSAAVTPSIGSVNTSVSEVSSTSHNHGLVSPTDPLVSPSHFAANGNSNFVAALDAEVLTPSPNPKAQGIMPGLATSSPKQPMVDTPSPADSQPVYSVRSRAADE